MANFSADYHIQKLMTVFTELVKSGRYSNPQVPIETALEDLRKTTDTLFQVLEKLGGQAGT
jgi:hypothetical protein